MAQPTRTAAPLQLSQDCLPFQGSRRKNGYGYTQFMGRQYLAHRLAFALNECLHPDALKGMVIRHRCDNPACINVEHLLPGTQRDNMADKVARRRHPRGEQCATSKLTADQVDEIRRTYMPRHPERGQRALARRFGVSQAAISHIVTGRSWAGGTAIPTPKRNP